MKEFVIFMCFRLSSELVIYFIIIFLHLSSAEYLIISKDLNYLYKTFSDVEETIFPNKLTINCSLSEIKGLLLYSMNKNGNQLIISLDDENESFIKVEFRKVVQYIKLKESCQCQEELCRYEPLFFQIIISKLLSIQCNNGPIQNIIIPPNNNINKDYPNIPFNQSKKNQARIWLINTPQYCDIYPNNQQLTGCIFDISYNNKHINMDKYDSKISEKCKKTCKTSTCGDGKCLETYSEKIICDCSNAFGNGPNCEEDSSSPKTKRKRNETFIVKKLKISVKNNVNTSKEIFSIRNDKHIISIQINKNEIYLNYTSINSLYSSIIGFIQDVNTTKYLIFLQFTDGEIVMKISQKYNSKEVKLPIKKDLSKELFNNMFLNENIIDVVYYTSWKNWRHFDKIYSITISKMLNQNEDNLKINYLKYIIVIGTLLLIFLIEINLIFYIKRSKKYHKNQNIIFS